MPRSRRIVGGLNPSPEHLRTWFQETPEPEVTTFFHDTYYASRSAARRFELYATPGGETLDSLIVWLPERADRCSRAAHGRAVQARSRTSTRRAATGSAARASILRDLDLLLELEPELLITGHDGPFRGAERIRDRPRRRVRDAVAYIHDETIAGMNAGKDLWTLMQEIELPRGARAELARAAARCTGTCARSGRSTPAGSGSRRRPSCTRSRPRAIWPELAELAGGPDVARRARCRARRGRTAGRGDALRRDRARRRPGDIAPRARRRSPRSSSCSSAPAARPTTSWPGSRASSSRRRRRSSGVVRGRQHPDRRSARAGAHRRPAATAGARPRRNPVELHEDAVLAAAVGADRASTTSAPTTSASACG